MREGEQSAEVVVLGIGSGGQPVAESLAGAGLDVVAVEVDPSRAAQLDENAHRLGATGVRVVVADGRDLPDELDGFDRALVDAPCSGLGVLASRPDLRWRAMPLPGLQLELLRSAVSRTRPGGTVVFSGWKNNGGGYQVWIAHGSGLYTTYNHMSGVSVGRGQHVSRGQRVGRMGATGFASGSHLHFEVWKGPIWNGGRRVNPLAYY